MSTFFRDAVTDNRFAILGVIAFVIAQLASQNEWIWKSLEGLFNFSKLSSTFRQKIVIQAVRGLYIATGQYSSLCVSAVVLILGGSDVMEVDEQDREQVDSERKKAEARERDKEDKTRTSNARSHMRHHG